MKNYTITVNGNVYDVTVEEGATTGTSVGSAPVSAPVTAAPPVVADPKPAASTTEGNVKVNSPMPGKIIAVKVKVGDAVAKGQVLVVLEAMKMENDVVASAAGTVASINAVAGGSVEAGEVLVTLN